MPHYRLRAVSDCRNVGVAMTWLLLIVVPVAVAYILWSNARLGPFTPSAIFVAVNGVSAVSILPLLDANDPADRRHAYIIGYCLLSFCLASLMVGSRVPRMVAGVVSVYRPGMFVGLIIAASVCITAAYFTAVGYSAFLLGVRNSLAGGSADVAGLRLDSYAGNRYLFPGYVNQVKNILLPGLTFVVAAYWMHIRRRHLLALTGLAAICLFGLLGTGQRGAFVMFVATLFVVAYLRTGRTFSRRGVLMGLVGLIVLMLSTFALGRQSGEVAAANGNTAKSGVILKQISERVLGQNGAGQVAGFRYIYAMKPTQGGRDWAQDVIGLLPGQRGSTISNEIFAYQWGSSRGNSPPSIWASMYLNFGLGGVVVCPVILAILFGLATKARQRLMASGANTLSVLGAAGVTICLGFWAAGSPVFLLNTGIAMYGLIWFAGQRVMKRSGAAEPTDYNSGLLEIA